MRGLTYCVIAVAGVALLVGCGGPSATAKFKAGYVSQRGPLNRTSDAIGSSLQQASSQSDAQLFATFHQLAIRWQSQLSQLETLKPPSNLAADFNTITGAATRVESDLNAVVAAAATHSVSAGRQAGASIVTDALAIRSAATTLKQKLGIK